MANVVGLDPLLILVHTSNGVSTFDGGSRDEGSFNLSSGRVFEAFRPAFTGWTVGWVPVSYSAEGFEASTSWAVEFVPLILYG